MSSSTAIRRPAPPSPPGPAVLEAFAAIVRHRLGLGALVRREGVLSRRLAETMRAAGAEGDDPREFVLRLATASPRSRLFAAFADTVPNHESYLFRDAEQLVAIARWLGGRRPAGRELRVLCAGCAAGEEVYSLLALVAGEAAPPVQVLGVDVSPTVVAQAALGTFPATATLRGEGAPVWNARLFTANGELLDVRPAIRERARFAVANLVDPAQLSALGDFDAVLCRNVLLYFDAAPAAAVLRTLQARLHPGGVIALGRTDVPPALPGWRPLGAPGAALYSPPPLEVTP